VCIRYCDILLGVHQISRHLLLPRPCSLCGYTYVCDVNWTQRARLIEDTLTYYQVWITFLAIYYCSELQDFAATLKASSPDGGGKDVDGLCLALQHTHALQLTATPSRTLGLDLFLDSFPFTLRHTHTSQLTATLCNTLQHTATRALPHTLLTGQRRWCVM